MAAESERLPHLNGASGSSKGAKDAEAASDAVHRSTSEGAATERSSVKSQSQPMSQVPRLSPNISNPSAPASATNSAVPSRESSPVRFSSRPVNHSPTRLSSQSRKASQDRSSPTRTSNGPTSVPPGYNTTSNSQRSSSSPVNPLVLSAPLETLANVASPEKSNMPSWAGSRRTDLDPAVANTSLKRASPTEEPATKVDRSTPRAATRGTSGQGSSLETVEEMASNPSTPSSESALKPVTAEEARLHRIDENPTSRSLQQNTGSGSDSGDTRSSTATAKEEPRSQASGATKPPGTLMPKQSTTSLSAGARGKPADGSVRNMTVETETVSSIPQVSLGVGAGERGNTSRADQGTLRMKPSTETIRPRKEKKKHRRPNNIQTGPATSKADIFEAKVANAVDEADVSDSDETFVYESNPPDPFPSRPSRYHSRTPSATSMASQVDQLAGRARGMRDGSHSVTSKRSMKFTNNPYNSSIDGDGPDVELSRNGSRVSGSGTITPRHHNIGRHVRNGVPAGLFDNESTPFPQSQSQPKSPRHFIGSGYRHSRHSNTRSSPNYKTINGTKKAGEVFGYDFDAEGADDERTPLVGTPRQVRSRHGRRPNSASLRQMEYMAQRQRGYFSQFGSCAIILLLLVIVAGGATSFIVAATQPLLDVQVVAIQNVLASEQEIMLDLNVESVNPNLFPVTIEDTDINIFAKSRFVGTDKLWRDHGDLDGFPRVEQSRQRWQLSQTVRCLGSVDCMKEAMSGHSNGGVDKGTDPPTDPEGDSQTMLLGRVFHFDSPLSFESSPWNHFTSGSKGQIRLTRPGNKTEEGGTERWERVLQHPFELIVRGVVKYQLPLSSHYLSASISSSVKYVPDDEDTNPKHPPSNDTARITLAKKATAPIRLPLSKTPSSTPESGTRRPFTA
ncbi:uncharacterized protein N7511_002760 [Penicillium nucicola]|uniref:uncharacterized protein n=1 Tax=Penicillium nucicola TaxID=1850975 RepID=UPI00254544F0|nr:uncharacterized protein N7511_002760 [Penicillium nucicola]KAJ5770709.1 hypothetical protein N7511_002760 [Penicillium nucicola]